MKYLQYIQYVASKNSTVEDCLIVFKRAQTIGINSIYSYNKILFLWCFYDLEEIIQEGKFWVGEDRTAYCSKLPLQFHIPSACLMPSTDSLFCLEFP